MSYRLEIGGALVFMIALGVAIWAGSRHSRVSELDIRSSTFLTGPSGSKALYDVLTRLGRPAERRRTSLRRLTTTRAHYPAVLAILDPVIPLDDDEIDQVVQYVRRGGQVVTSGFGGGVLECLGWRIQSDIGLDSVAVRAPNGLKLPRAARVLTVAHRDTTTRRGIAGLRKGDDEDATRASCRTLVPYAADTIVAAVNNRPVVMRLRYRDGGSVTLASDGGWFTNTVWRDTDVPMILLGVLTPSLEHPGRIAFDEYHQGFGEHRGASLSGQTWIWLTQSPAGWAILQLIAVALVWLATLAVRFGPAHAVIERRRRSPLEHLEALGAGLESAEDADTAVQRLALGLRRRLSRAGQPLPATSGDLLPWLEGLELAMRAPSGRTAVRRLQHLLRARDRDETRVLDTAQAVEDVWEELRPREKRNGS